MNAWDKQAMEYFLQADAFSMYLFIKCGQHQGFHRNKGLFVKKTFFRK